MSHSLLWKETWVFVPKKKHGWLSYVKTLHETEQNFGFKVILVSAIVCMSFKICYRAFPLIIVIKVFQYLSTNVPTWHTFPYALITHNVHQLFPNNAPPSLNSLYSNTSHAVVSWSHDPKRVYLHLVISPVYLHEVISPDHSPDIHRNSWV